MLINILVLEKSKFCWLSSECLTRADALGFPPFTQFLCCTLCFKRYYLISPILVPSQLEQFTWYITLDSSLLVKLIFNSENKFLVSLFVLCATKILCCHKPSGSLIYKVTNQKDEFGYAIITEELLHFANIPNHRGININSLKLFLKNTIFN